MTTASDPGRRHTLVAGLLLVLLAVSVPAAAAAPSAHLRIARQAWAFWVEAGPDDQRTAYFVGASQWDDAGGVRHSYAGAFAAACPPVDENGFCTPTRVAKPRAIANEDFTIDPVLDSAHLVLRINGNVYESTWSGTLPGAAGPWANLCGRGILAKAIASRGAAVDANVYGHTFTNAGGGSGVGVLWEIAQTDASSFDEATDSCRRP